MNWSKHEQDQSYRILVLGDKSVGKSTICSKITLQNSQPLHCQTFLTKYQSTWFELLELKSKVNIPFDGLILVFDTTQIDSFISLQRYTTTTCPVLIIGTRTDCTGYFGSSGYKDHKLYHQFIEQGYQIMTIGLNDEIDVRNFFESMRRSVKNHIQLYM